VIAEDEVLLRLMVADALRGEGFQVFEAADADEAISILVSTPDVDVVITDMQMRSTQDGMGLANYVRAHRPGVSLLLASALIPPVIGPFDAVFAKPYNPQEIVTWIRRRCASEENQALSP
jgi:CheY-like chemotaxis protein